MAEGARPLPKNGSAATSGRFGTFAGVFTPNILTILGIILFLRLGWVVGQAGMWQALLIVMIANSISMLTGLSLSAIATNMRVGAGGNYYLISRSLGLEIGGAIGIPLFLSQAISVAFYIIGFTEALVSVEFFQQFDPRLIATVVALLFGVISYIGADFALKIQYFILAVLIVALVSFFTGGSGSFPPSVTTPTYSEGVTFWIVFAVFFPAVTGIEVGTSLSGDLKDPSRNIPRGTILSILVTALVYAVAVVWFATHSTQSELVNNNFVMQSVARWPELILAGVWASTLSSALGSVLAAPRTLQAIARDRVIPYWMGAQLGSPTEPRMAVLLTSGIAIGVIWMGDLNFVAPIISMFFLNTYGMVNLAAAIEKLVGNPSYRPRFRIPWLISLLGAFGCYGAMFLINVPATLFAISVSYGVFFLLQRRRIERTWGDVRNGVWIALARQALLRLEQNSSTDVKNWRPNMIVFTGQPHNRQQLVEVAQWLSQGQGIVTFFQFINGRVDNPADVMLRETARKHIHSFIERNGMSAFAEAEIVEDFHDGAVMVAQAHGIGQLESNAVLMGWSRTESGRGMQMHLMLELVALGKSVLFLNHDSERGFGNRRIINIWWQGRGGNADLMLLLAHIIQRAPSWHRSTIQLVRIVDSETAIEQTEVHMNELLESVRVDATPLVIVRHSADQKLSDLILSNSQNADLSLIGMRLPSNEDRDAYGERLNALVSVVGSVLLVHNAQRDEDLLATDGI